MRNRFGTEPRVTADPRQAFTFCAESGGLLVFEYAGPDWLPIIRDLRNLCGTDISMVAAVGPERMGDVSGLQRAGADEVVAWEGRPEPVAWAVERVMAGRGDPEAAVAPPPPPVTKFDTPVPQLGTEPPPLLKRGAAPPARPAPPAAAAPPPFTPRPSAPPADPPRVPAAAQGAARAAAAAPAAATAAAPAWPLAIPNPAEAERILWVAAKGAGASDPSAAPAVAFAEELTTPERDAFGAGQSGAGAGLLRRVAALRLRVSIALETVPPPGSSHDGAAVQALLAEIDGELQNLKAPADATPADAQALEAVRNALVKEAIDLTDAVQRIAPSGAAPVAAAPRAPVTRVLSVERVDAEEHAQGRRRTIALAVALGLAVAGAAAFHGVRYVNKPARAEPPTQPGMPPGATAVQDPRTGVLFLVPPGGKPLDPIQLDRLKEQEALKGRTVQQVGNNYMIIPNAVQRGGETR